MSSDVYKPKWAQGPKELGVVAAAADLPWSFLAVHRLPCVSSSLTFVLADGTAQDSSLWRKCVEPLGTCSCRRSPFLIPSSSPPFQ